MASYGGQNGMRKTTSRPSGPASTGSPLPGRAKGRNRPYSTRATFGALAGVGLCRRSSRRSRAVGLIAAFSQLMLIRCFLLI